jgi:type I restriction enzyme S subunit
MKDNNSIPAGWKWVECQEVIDVRDGTHDTPKYVSSGFPLITSKNLSISGINLDEVQFISEEDHRNISKRSRVDKGDILYAMIGTIGNPAIVETETDFSIKNIALFKFHQGLVYNKFFKHMLDADIIKRQILSKARGGIQKFASLKVLRGLKIPLPPIAEQKRIAAILDKADSIRRKRRLEIQLADEFLRSVFLDMFGDPVWNPKGWNETRLDQISEIVSGVTKGRKLNNKATVLVPYMRVANVQDGRIFIDDVQEIEALESEIEKFRLKRGDILLTEGGDPDKLGRGAVWKGEIDPCIHQNHIFRVRTTKKIILPEYLSALIGSQRGKRYFLKEAKQTTGVASINKTQLSGFPVLVPPIVTQYEYLRRLEKFDHMVDIQMNKYNESGNLFNSIVQRAFRGEL